MIRNALIIIIVSAITTWVVVLGSKADAQGPTPLPSVWLQPTPDVNTQTGNITISGAVRASDFRGNAPFLQNLGAHNITSGRLNLIGVQNGNPIIRGQNDGTAGAVMGVLGYCSAQGTGVYGVTVGANSTAVAAWAAGSGSTQGGEFNSDGSAGIGVTARALSTLGVTYGVFTESGGPGGYGVYSRALGTGTTTGVYGEVTGTNGRGVYGRSTSGGSLSYGVLGTGGGAGVAGSAIVGVYGSTGNAAGKGVYGQATATTGTNYGVYGEADLAANGFAVYAQGDMGASGLKPFRIDHPADPENKYLLHYASESPYPQNFYSGNTVTDQSGYAWVELPEYFDQINTDCKYQLTVISEEFAQAIVSRKISKNRFQIRTSLPSIEVSWRVEANRNDPYVRYKQPRDVVTKPGEELGTYQMPELYGLPASRALRMTPPSAEPGRAPSPRPSNKNISLPKKG